jgi:hypothetical protein
MARTKQSERKTIKAIKKEKEQKPVKNGRLIKEKKEKKHENAFQKQKMQSLDHIIDSTNLISLNDQVMPSEPSLMESSNAEIKPTLTKEEKKEKYLWGCQLD